MILFVCFVFYLKTLILEYPGASNDLASFKFQMMLHHEKVLKFNTQFKDQFGWKSIITLVHFCDFYGESDNEEEAEIMAFKKFIEYMIVLQESAQKQTLERERVTTVRMEENIHQKSEFSSYISKEDYISKAQQPEQTKSVSFDSNNNEICETNCCDDNDIRLLPKLQTHNKNYSKEIRGILKKNNHNHIKLTIPDFDLTSTFIDSRIGKLVNIVKHFMQSKFIIFYNSFYLTFLLVDRRGVIPLTHLHRLNESIIHDASKEYIGMDAELIEPLKPPVIISTKDTDEGASYITKIDLVGIAQFYTCSDNKHRAEMDGAQKAVEFIRNLMKLLSDFEMSK